MTRKIIHTAKRLARNVRDIEKMLINQGRILSRGYAAANFADIREAEFQVFSQWGEDGIIQYITKNIAMKNKTFIEFGVETFIESNCRFIMENDYWSGFIIDGSESNVKKIIEADFYWKYNLSAINAFVTAENITQLLSQRKFDKVGILSVDIDGIDYFVLENCIHLEPEIVIVEYNSLFGVSSNVSVPYSANFRRTEAHFSNLYYGASLGAFNHLLTGQGYALVGGNSAGNNAFFVRQDLLNDKIKAVPVDMAYREASFAEGRNADGTLNFVRGAQRRHLIADLPLVDVVTGDRLFVKDLSLA